MDTATVIDRLIAKPRDISVDIDPVDAIFVVAALAELETRYGLIPAGRYPSRAERLRRVRESIERAVYGEPTEAENRELWGK